MKEKKKQKFRAIGIDSGKPSIFAKKVQSSLNALESDGYALRMVSANEKGVLIIGELQEPTQFPFPLRRAPAPVAPPPAASKARHPQTDRICGTVLSTLQHVPSSQYRETLEKLMPRLSNGLTPTELLNIAGDLRDMADEHKVQAHEDGDTCIVPDILMAASEYLSERHRPNIN